MKDTGKIYCLLSSWIFQADALSQSIMFTYTEDSLLGGEVTFHVAEAQGRSLEERMETM